jgi:diguanylate cyclase (GGDEF)-like protein
VIINDGVQSASVLSAATNTLQPGDLVEAVGYPVLSDTGHTIDDAIFKRLGTAPLPVPTPVSAKEALSGDFEGDLIRVDGRLIEQQKATGQETLLVYAGDAVFSAILPGEFKDDSLAALRNGSTVRLTGVCVISETQESRHFRLPKAFQILLRSPSDIVVIESPSWWTPAHALLVLGFALAGTVLVLAWVVALRRRVKQQTDLLREQAELLKESESRYRHMAHHDALTGLATRVVLKDRLSVALEAARRHRTGLTLLMLDLDNFKKINDTLGHHAGDEVLRVTANRLLDSVRKSDTVARIGGDEFVILLPESCDRLSAEIIAEKLIEVLSVSIPFEEQTIPVSVSIGVCISSAGESGADELMKIADAALYAAKEHGRNRYEILSTEVTTH